MANKKQVNIVRNIIDNNIQDIKRDMGNLSDQEIAVALRYLLDEYSEEDTK